ncbi:MAG TPA: flagellar assembly protein FliW [Candidatus Hydrogenedentes bacterium]|nr:flagellar assembly protein FliW [Candidatus Hydrogenedentota bacterium]
MQVTTTRFGVLEVAPESVYTFTQPIIGFQEYRRFVLLAGPSESRVYWLQSTESGELAFLLMNPRDVMPDYTVPLNPHDLSELAASTMEELEVYTLVVVPEDPAKIRTNLKAPIVINRKRHLAKQTVIDRNDYPIQYFLAGGKAGAREPRRDQSHARTNA